MTNPPVNSGINDIVANNYAKINITDALARVPGVGNVAVFGERDYGMRVWLDPDKLPVWA